MRKPPKLRLGEITSHLVGIPYSLGGKAGHDCISLIWTLCRQWGIKAPHVYGGYDENTYPSLYEESPDKATQLLADYAGTLGEEIPVETAFAGDLLVAKVKTGQLSVGIHAGKDRMLVVLADRGVCTVPLRFYEIMKAYRPKLGEA